MKCDSCNKSVKDILKHLQKSKACQENYDVDQIRQSKMQERLEKKSKEKYERNRDEIRAARAEHYSKNKQSISVAKAEHFSKNKESIRVAQADYYQRSRSLSCQR